MVTIHHIESLHFSNDRLQIIIDGKQYAFSISGISKKLSSANDSQRNNYIISPSGYGIQWPELDEDLSINALLNSLDNEAA